MNTALTGVSPEIPCKESVKGYAKRKHESIRANGHTCGGNMINQTLKEKLSK